jgi:hypothetical protein
MCVLPLGNVTETLKKMAEEGGDKGSVWTGSQGTLECDLPPDDQVPRHKLPTCESSFGIPCIKGCVSMHQHALTCIPLGTAGWFDRENLTVEMPRCNVGGMGDITHRFRHIAGFKTLQSEQVWLRSLACMLGAIRSI